MILLVDRGNTRTKWRLVDEQGGRLDGVETGASFDVLRSQLPLDAPVQTIILASVATDELTARITVDLTHLFPSVPHLRVRVLHEFRGLIAAYDDVSQLGVDRWLQLLALNESKRFPALLVSLGTALTVDKLDQDGRHIGGQIAPGWQMLNTVVPASTGKINAALAAKFYESDLGRSTDACLAHGVSDMFASYLSTIAGRYGGDCLQKCLTGGDAERFHGKLADFSLRKGLVLDGLEVVASHLNDYKSL